MKTTKHLIIGLAAVIVAGLLSAPTARAQSALVMTDDGPVQGVVTPTIVKYLGIPYAAPPVGSLRWQPPQAHAPWSTPIDATAFANHCPQIPSPFGVASNSEDCLYLNVYTPAAHPHRRRPVMVWIHGGAFQVGESDDYDPTRLLEIGDVIVVTINYRIGALGFLAHPALSAESPDQVSGNYGILDQQFALQWVQRNIAAFGGNPRKVTIFGESAGGSSVHAQLVSPLAAGLFQRAIVESGAIFREPTLAAGEQQGSAVADALGCSDQTAECLRAASVGDILANQGISLTSASPVIDGVVLPSPILTLLKNGEFNHVPVIQGSNHDEFRLFVALEIELMSGPLTAAGYQDAIGTLLGLPPALASLLAAQYPVANYPSPSVALGALATDAAFACNARAADRATANYVPTFAYEFQDANAPELFLPPVSFPYGASHASELQYLFDLPSPFPPQPLTADQQELSTTMIRYWTRFARNGRPKATHALRWPKYDVNAPNGETFLTLVPPSPGVESSATFAADHQCAFWDPLLGH